MCKKLDVSSSNTLQYNLCASKLSAFVVFNTGYTYVKHFRDKFLFIIQYFVGVTLIQSVYSVYISLFVTFSFGNVSARSFRREVSL